MPFWRIVATESSPLCLSKKCEGQTSVNPSMISSESGTEIDSASLDYLPQHPGPTARTAYPPRRSPASW